MGKYNNINGYIDSEGLKKLESIRPYDVVLDALTEAVECYPYTIQHSKSHPMIVFYRNGMHEEEDYELIPSSLPRIIVELFDPSHPRCLIRLDMPKNFFEVYEEAFNSTAYSYCFKPCFYDYVQGFIAVFEIDIRMVACLITYYLQFLRILESDLQVNKSMDVSLGDMSLAIIPDDVMVPDTFRRAYAKLQELDVQEADRIFMRLRAGDSPSENGWLDVDVWKEDDDLFYSEQQAVGGREALERRRTYRNFDCIYYYIHTKIYREFITFPDPDFMMRFLTDYFLFLYPQVRQEDIVTSLICVKEIGYDDVLYKEYFFYPDGSEDPPEKLVDFITTMQNWRKSN